MIPGAILCQQHSEKDRRVSLNLLSGGQGEFQATSLRHNRPDSLHPIPG
jgi:hypothetical protein